MSSSRKHSEEQEEEIDVVEMKKAIATGSAKDGAGVSSGVYTWSCNVMTELNMDFIRVTQSLLLYAIV